MRKAQVLIVDDETDILELLQITLSRMDIGCREAVDVDGAKSLLANNSFDFRLTEMCLPDGSGIDLVRHIKHRCSSAARAVFRPPMAARFSSTRWRTCRFPRRSSCCG